MKIAIISPESAFVHHVRVNHTQIEVFHLGDLDTFTRLVDMTVQFTGVIIKFPAIEVQQVCECLQLKQTFPHLRLMVISPKECDPAMIKMLKKIDLTISLIPEHENIFREIEQFLIQLTTLGQAETILDYQLSIAGGIILDTAIHSLVKGGEIVPLPGKEYELMMYFQKNKGRFVTVDQILLAVWDEYTTPENVRQYVYKLRQKLEGGLNSKVLAHRKGFGYILLKEENNAYLNYLLG
ncbi:winged helix-turn-helix domain-containing protein [Paenibacillus sp.]|uniref:winged helix-turn-helix domain-containing protein n=1 Tax=Paenibacillus sp. TaxID=58172 RepID=UPI0028253F98|nr:winged helix-turn-helix domain-containing protein [Paenibacillus sp.]MDR0267470.1 winged helix-turn-helix domain-containing protein [Paenibacillus sp.]